MKGFSVRSGVCAECRTGVQEAEASRTAKDVTNRPQRKKPPPPPAGPKSWKCPNCLKRVDVKRAALVPHNNARGVRCAGSEYQLPQKSTDALDYRVAGSFEGGRGR